MTYVQAFLVMLIGSLACELLARSFPSANNAIRSSVSFMVGMAVAKMLG